jgi:two-component system, OmpR family, KDP operon response regulator KdpE
MVVLVVEDDAAIRALCRITFERARLGPLRGVRYVDAGDLKDARAAIASEAPDLVVMDVRLPDGNGLDLLREIRDAGNRDGTRVIIASASVLPSERDAALAAGADRFLPKPYRPSELVEAVAALLAGAHPT